MRRTSAGRSRSSTGSYGWAGVSSSTISFFDPDFPQEPGVAHLRAALPDKILWEATTRDVENQVLQILVWTDELDPEGTVTGRRYRRIGLSWMTPEQSRALLQQTGFAIEDVYGDFDGNPLEAGSTHQIWLARRD